jgi:hypothetical protein
MLHVLSTLVVIGIGVGLWFRHRNPKYHMPIMVACFVADVSLVLWIELNRHAVETVVKSIKPIVLVHAGISLTTIVCYLALLGLGFGLFRGNGRLRLTHKRVGMTFMTFRLLNYATAFFVVAEKPAAPTTPLVATNTVHTAVVAVSVPQRSVSWR